MTVTELQRIPKEQLQEIPSMQEWVMELMIQKEDEFYKYLLQQLINREPTIEDYKDITLASHINYPNQKLIAYKGRPFGRITQGFGSVDFCTYTWTFEPIITFKDNATI